MNQRDCALSFTWNVGGCQRVSEFWACGSSVRIKKKQNNNVKQQVKTEKDIKY